MHRISSLVLVLVLVFGACGGDVPEAGTRVADADAAARAQTGAATATDSGTFEIDGTTYAFRVTRCDLTGTRYEGILIHGAGEAPDGRRISVEVERLDHGNWLSHNAMVVIGGMMEGDVWEASVHRLSDGRWFEDEVGMEPASGPLLEITDTEVVARGRFERDSDNVSQQATLRATCAS